MKIRLFGAAVMALCLSAPVITKADTYTIQNPLGSAGQIHFPALTSANLASGGVGGLAGFIETDGTLGSLSAANIVSFQLGVSALLPPNLWSSDVSAPLPGLGTVFIEGTAFFATPTGLFFDFGSASSSYVKFERDSTSLGQADTFFCLNAGGANCGGATSFDVTAAVLFPRRPDWSVFIGRSQSDLVNSLNLAGIVSDTGVFHLAERGAFGVPGPVVGAAGLPSLLVGGGLLAWWRRKRAQRWKYASIGR